MESREGVRSPVRLARSSRLSGHCGGKGAIHRDEEVSQVR